MKVCRCQPRSRRDLLPHRQAAWFQRRGKWTRRPAPGHVVFFAFGSRHINHVGIVEFVRPDGTVTTIEGNTSNSVRRRNRRKGIVGYGVPGYSANG
jgi:hypothetical protein